MTKQTGLAWLDAVIPNAREWWGMGHADVNKLKGIRELLSGLPEEPSERIPAGYVCSGCGCNPCDCASLKAAEMPFVTAADVQGELCQEGAVDCPPYPHRKGPL